MMVYDVHDDAIMESNSVFASLLATLRHAYNCAYIWFANFCYAAGRFL